MTQSVGISRPRFLCAARSGRFRADGSPTEAGGYTLVELLVVVCLLGLAVAIPSLSLLRALNRSEARNTAQVLQGSITQAQVDAIYLGCDKEVACTESSVRVGSTGATFNASLSCPSPETNVPRWRMANGGVGIQVLAPFGSPSSAGSVVFLPSGGGARVVVRAASGLTRRDVP